MNTLNIRTPHGKALALALFLIGLVFVAEVRATIPAAIAAVGTELVVRRVRRRRPSPDVACSSLRPSVAVAN